MSDPNNAKLFVGRLPDGCTEKDLEDLFRTYGTVNQTDVVGKYGFVHMIKKEEAEEAIKKLNNYNFMGSQLTVQFSTSKLNNNSVKGKRFPNNMNNNRRGMKRTTGPYRSNNTYPQSRAPTYDQYSGPPPGPPNQFAPYYEDPNPYYRDGYYPESEPFYGQTGDAMGAVPQYEAPMPYGRRVAPPVANYPRAPAPLQPDLYGGGDVSYTQPLAYNPNRAMPPTDTRAMSFGGPARNGYGTTGYANRGPAGPGGRANAAPPPPPSARWQPY